jgi:hypothetical protein
MAKPTSPTTARRGTRPKTAVPAPATAGRKAGSRRKTRAFDAALAKELIDEHREALERLAKR